jgi:hypothetical protein
MRFQILTTVKTTVFWNVTSRSFFIYGTQKKEVAGIYVTNYVKLQNRKALGRKDLQLIF